MNKIMEVIRPMKLKVYKLTDKAVIPEFGTSASACFDLSVCFWRPVKYRTSVNREELLTATPDSTFYLEYGERILIPTGLIFDIPDGYHIEIFSRSGLSWKNWITVTNGTGIIDDDYREETMVILQNNAYIEFNIKHGDRIAQAKLVKTLKYSVSETRTNPEMKTLRNGGFGSTGM
jgi:dUTP pyrophosphatase